MKKILLITFSFLLLNTNLIAQVFVSLKNNTNRARAYGIGYFRICDDGLYHYKELNNLQIETDYDRYIKGKERFYCYDKSNRIFYFYTDNMLGYYIPRSNYSFDRFKEDMIANNVPKVKQKDALILMDKLFKEMNEKFILKNDSITQKKERDRVQHIKDSILNEQRKDAARAEYRKTHDWRDLSMSKHYFLQCDFCDKSHYVKEYDVLAICADTLYYFNKIYDINLLGIKHFGIHYSSLTEEFKKDKKFIEYVNTWRDSIANYNGTINNKEATILNIVRYNEFKKKVFETAPNGFILKWGWELNSAEGIEPYFSYFNSSKKTIKYVDLFFSVYNAVGDRCYLKYDNSYVGRIRGVGPVEPFDSGSWQWDRATHYTTPDASEFRINKLVITYMDGTTKTLPRNMILYDDDVY